MATAKKTTCVCVCMCVCVCLSVCVCVCELVFHHAREEVDSHGEEDHLRASPGESPRAPPRLLRIARASRKALILAESAGAGCAPRARRRASP